jgi:hypothetical protein
MVMWLVGYLKRIDGQCAIDVGTGRIHIMYAYNQKFAGSIPDVVIAIFSVT